MILRYERVHQLVYSPYLREGMEGERRGREDI
jgi:hypothetical protein